MIKLDTDETLRLWRNFFDAILILIIIFKLTLNRSVIEVSIVILTPS